MCKITEIYIALLVYFGLCVRVKVIFFYSISVYYYLGQQQLEEEEKESTSIGNSFNDMFFLFTNSDVFPATVCLDSSMVHTTGCARGLALNMASSPLCTVHI